MWLHIQTMENLSESNNVRLKERCGTDVTLLTCVQKILTGGLLALNLSTSAPCTDAGPRGAPETGAHTRPETVSEG